MSALSGPARPWRVVRRADLARRDEPAPARLEQADPVDRRQGGVRRGRRRRRGGSPSPSPGSDAPVGQLPLLFVSDFEAAVVATAVVAVVDAVVDAGRRSLVASSVVATSRRWSTRWRSAAVVAAVATVVAVSVSPLSAAALDGHAEPPRTAKPARLDAPTSRRARRAGCGRRRRRRCRWWCGLPDLHASIVRRQPGRTLSAWRRSARERRGSEPRSTVPSAPWDSTRRTTGSTRRSARTSPPTPPQPDELQRALITETAERTGNRAGHAGDAPIRASLLALFVGLVGARNVVEVGTFTGYSSLCMARALPAGGRLLCCDVSEEWTAIARRYWARCRRRRPDHVAHRPGLETLRALPPDVPIDLAFIDADKTGYAAYYDEMLAAAAPERA